MAGSSPRSSLSRVSTSYTVCDDIDAITPCPSSSPTLTETTANTPSTSSRFPSAVDIRSIRSPSPSSDVEEIEAHVRRDRRRDSIEALQQGTEGDPLRLWERMLKLHALYGCYKSARMSAALESGDISLLMPSRACLDLLNEHMDLLPDDANRVIKQSVATERAQKRRKASC